MRLAALGSWQDIIRIAATAGCSEYVERKDPENGISPLKQVAVKSLSVHRLTTK
jgi:hypothetical protein